MPSEPSAIAAQIQAFLVAMPARPTAADGAREGWELAITSEMEHTLVSGYACALTLDNEVDRLNRRVHDLALRIDGELAQVSELRRTKRELSQRSGELTSLREMLGQLRDRVRERSEALRPRDEPR